LGKLSYIHQRKVFIHKFLPKAIEFFSEKEKMDKISAFFQ